MMHRHGFTLVELAIVLVIIGLVIGGVVVGQDLVRGGQLRALTSEHQQFITAIQGFRSKYSGYPGDIKNATGIWGDDATYCADATITNGNPGTCNGDGDAIIDNPSALSTTGESYQFFKQLQLAGLIGGSFTGVAGSAGATDSVINSNVPASRFSGAGWSAGNAANFAGDTSAYAVDYGNYLVIGGKTTSSLMHAALFTPPQAYDLDSKVDDGKPGTGTVIARYWNSACANGSSNADYNSSYRLTDNTAQCALYFTKIF